MLEYLHIARAVLVFLRRDLEIRIIIAIFFRELATVLEIQIFIKLLFKYKRLREYSFEPTLYDFTIGKPIPQAQKENQNGEVEGYTILIVRIDEIVDKRRAAI
jgi:hypothetical protein